jgi:SAM-dependent methyltransferase
MKCRHCAYELHHTFLDLGSSPPSNAYLSQEDLSRPERFYPLRLRICEACWLAQTEDYAEADQLFDAEYAYFSSTSSTWLQHAARYVDAIVTRIGLSRASFVLEIASNDGYLLRNFVDRGIPCLGIEPTASTAAAAEGLGIPVRRQFFGEKLGRELAETGRAADLIIGNNVYAHVPDINDFTRGIRAALKPEGTLTLEFPHLLQLVQHNQFDTVYHEHFSYLSLYAVRRIFEAAGLRIWDVEELPTHGGSLRVFGCHAEDVRPTMASVSRVLDTESALGLQTLRPYEELQSKAEKIKDDLLIHLIQAKRAGRVIAGYGAAAKGNTLLNFAGVKPDLMPFVCDAALSKQGRFMPGSRIPILPPDELRKTHPAEVLILPWNIAPEVMRQEQSLIDRGTKFLVAIPSLRHL